MVHSPVLDILEIVFHCAVIVHSEMPSCLPLLGQALQKETVKNSEFPKVPQGCEFLEAKHVDFLLASRSNYMSRMLLRAVSGRATSDGKDKLDVAEKLKNFFLKFGKSIIAVDVKCGCDDVAAMSQAWGAMAQDLLQKGHFEVQAVLPANAASEPAGHDSSRNVDDEDSKPANVIMIGDLFKVPPASTKACSVQLSSTRALAELQLAIQKHMMAQWSTLGC